MKEKMAAVYIVKNEEKFIAKSLNSVMPYVSQIVVIDTGSNDKTAIIASQMGAEVYFYKWNDNFSNARNYALKHIRREWIIALDADEIIENNIEFNKIITPNENIGGLSCKLINFINKDDNTQFSTHTYTRIFKNKSNIFYQGAIHEQVRESIENSNLQIIDSDIKIYHYGYIDPSDDKKLRNKTLLEKQYDDNDHFNIFHLAETEFSLNNNKRAKELFFKVKDSAQLNNDINEKIRLKLSQIILSKRTLTKEDYHEIENLLSFQTKNIDHDGFRKFILGASCLMQKEYKKAKEFYTSEEVLKSSMVDRKVIDKAMLVFDKL